MNRCLFCGNSLRNSELDFHSNCSLKFFNTKTPPRFPYKLNEIAELAKSVIERSVTVPGVQAKLSLGLIKEVLSEETSYRLTIVGALGGNYIVKPPVNEYPQMPEIEYLTMQIAEYCRIKVVPYSLIRMASGELAYITRRVDRSESGEKLHQLDMFQITEAFDKYRSSMERIGKAVATYSAYTLLDLLRLFELTVFCYITGNNDMHLKNFSLLLDEVWTLAPAYDLLNVQLLLPEDKEESALTINGKRNNLKKSDFDYLGKNFGLNEKQIQNTFNRFVNNENGMLIRIDNSFLSEENKKRYKALLQKRISLFK